MAEEGKEKKDSSVVGNVNSAVARGKDIRRAYKAVRTGRTVAMAAEGAGALAGAGGPVTVGIAAVLLVVVIILFSGGAPSAVVGGEPTDTASPSASFSPGPTLAPGQKPNEVFYCQWQGAWRDQPYDTSTVAHTGCSPTSMAMIFSSYGITKTPGDIATIFHQKGWDWLPGSGHVGTNPWATINRAWLNSMGLERAQTDIVNNSSGTTSLNLQTVKNYTDAGWLLYTAVYWPKISGGHQIVIESANPSTGTITIRDPNDCPNGIRTISASGYLWYLITPIRIK